MAVQNPDEIHVVLVAPDGSLGSGPVFSLADAPLDVAVGDAQNDGDLEVAVLFEFQIALLDTAPGGTTPIVTGPLTDLDRSLFALAFEDVSGDSIPDLQATSTYTAGPGTVFDSTAGMVLLLGLGDGSFGDARYLPSLRSPTGDLDLADLNGDGALDWVIGSRRLFESVLDGSPRVVRTHLNQLLR